MLAELSKKILIIEDDATTRSLFLQSLNAEGFETIVAQNATLGIQQAQTHLPDLVICDLLMSDMDGFNVLIQLRQNPLTAIIPFIFLTANNTRIAVRKAMELGADDYLSKPATIDELLRAITIRFKKQSLLRQSHQINQSQIPELLSSEFIFPTSSHLQEVFDYIESHYHEGITLSNVAEAVGYSPAYLTTQVAKQTGVTVNNWIVKRRMAASRHLLKNTTQSIEEVATKLGYQNPCHFSRQFRQHHHVSPSSWRKQHQFLQVSRNPKLQFPKNRQLSNSLPLR
jgi:YesN/AraC family two-component response regulator